MSPTPQDDHDAPVEGKTERPRKKRRKWFSNRAIAVILLCAVLGTVVGYMAAKTQPYMWQVQALLLAHVGRESGSARSEIVAAGGSSHIVAPPSPESLNTEIQLLRSPALLRKTWDSVKAELQAMIDQQKAKMGKESAGGDSGAGGGGGFSPMGLLNQGISSLFRSLDLAYQVDPEELQFASWSNSLIVAQVPKSNMLMVAALSPNPYIAKTSLERWISEYVDKHVEAYSQTETTPLFDKEVLRLRDEVRRIEDELSAFRRETKIFDIEQKKESLVRQKLGIEDSLRHLKAEMKTEAARIAEIEKQMEEVREFSLQSSSRGSNPTWDYLDRELVEAEQKLRAAELEFKDPNSPFLRRARETRDYIKEMIEGKDASRDTSQVVGRDPIHSDLEGSWYRAVIQQKTSEAHERALLDNMKEVEAELVRVEDLRPQHAKLIDELKETHKDLQQMLEGSRIARMNTTLDRARVTNVKVVSPPSIPSEPMTLLGLPHRVAITGAGGVIGLLLALGLYLVRMTLREAGLLRRLW